MRSLCFTVTLLLSTLSLSVCDDVIASVTCDHTGSCSLHNGIVKNYVAKGKFRNEINSTGWSFLEISTEGSFPDEYQAYAAGVVEGHLTKELMRMAWVNTVAGYCDEPLTPYCQRLRKYLNDNLVWMKQQIKNNMEDDYWRMVNNYLVQVNGLNDGYFYKPGTSLSGTGSIVADIDPMGVFMFQIGGDLEDLGEALGDTARKHVLGSGSCSALIKLTPDDADLYFSHDTWNSYQSMIRVIKRYNFAYHTKSSGKLIPGAAMTFTSYPGTLLSGDDFYIISSGLAVQETTIGNSNSDLWKFVRPQSVLEGIRTMVSNLLATNGDTWTNVFTKYNSGTYNNQWMVVDYKRFKPNSKNMTSLLYVLEQIPGYIVSNDVTDVLMKQSYWPSYNIPYYPKIFNMSGGPSMVEQFGEWFSYDGSPRAKIFKRDHGKVVDMKSMIRLMRYNDYTHDPLSRCNCTPPYSAENAISARCDLNPASGTYPFGALGHRSHGGTDMKLTNSSMAVNLQFVSISGPTYDQLPPFQWSKADFRFDTPHEGQPDLFKFDPILYDGTTNYRLYKP
ncbi:hypothetical protein FSP39_010917 [Pinctada imbricata]|uniref:Phospholipase B-like n=1 Tax=Pinctada imbricata TaxID=66713 RepID=A0AA89BJ71_PINIB|nr:hypothetical protein FSP39_010917 [Pinctada imbricata]